MTMGEVFFDSCVMMGQKEKFNFGDKNERNWLPVVRLCFDLFEGEQQQQQPQHSCGSVMSLCADSFMIYSCLLKGERFAKLRLIKEKINSFVGGSR